MHLSISIRKVQIIIWVLFRNEYTKTGGPTVIFQNACNMQRKWHFAETFYSIIKLSASIKFDHSSWKKTHQNHLNGILPFGS